MFKRFWERWPRAAVPASFALLGLFWWAAPLLRGQVLFYDTLLRYFHPNTVFFARSLSEGHFPFWNPHLYSGLPHLANIQAALLYPFTYLALVMSFGLWLSVNTWLHGVIAAWGMEKWMRGLGLSRPASWLAGAAFAFNGFFVMHYAYPSHLQSYAWAPWAAYAFHQALSSGSWRYVWLTAGALAMAILGGHPQFVIFTCLMLLIAALFFWERLWASGRLAAAAGAATALTCAQWVPFLELWRRTPRAGAFNAEWALDYSLMPAEFLRMLLTPLWNFGWRPQSGDPHIVGFYFGLPLLALALAGAGGRHRRYWLVLAGVGVLWSFGRHLPGFSALAGAVPVLGGMRFPAQAAALTAVAVAGLAALGVDRLGRWGRWVAAAAVFDLWVFSWNALDVLPPAVYDRPSAAAEALAAERARVFLAPPSRGQEAGGASRLEAWLSYKDRFLPNTGLAAGLDDMDGYEEMRSAEYERVIEEIMESSRSRWLDALAAGWIFSFDPMPDPSMKPTALPHVYRNTEALPRAYVVPEARQVPAAGQLAYPRENPGFDFRRAVLLASEGSAGDAAGTVEWRRDGPNRFLAEVESSGPGWLVLAESYDPGWRATARGKEEKVRRANYWQRAVPVPAGKTSVEMSYRPFGWPWAPSANALALVLWAAALRRRVNRRR